MNYQFTESVQQALETASQLAQQNHNTELNDQHVLSAFLEDESSYFNTLLSSWPARPLGSFLFMGPSEAACKSFSRAYV